VTRHVLEIDDLAPAEVARVLDLADDPSRPAVLAGQTVGLYFEKPSLRTRHSCETAVVQLAGHPVTFRTDEIGGSGREPIGDIARVLSGYHAALGARVFDHRVLEQLAAASAIPVVNLLSDTGHPCQSLADLLTMRRAWGDLAGRTIAWIGDFNNVARSLALGAAMSGMRLRIASPAGYGPSEPDLDRLLAAGLDGPPTVTDRPAEAAAGADAVHTDVWASMGQEDEADVRHRAFEGFQVDEAVMAAAARHALFMHCLPAHRGEEVAAVVVDGPHSAVFPQAHNRLHAFRGLLRFLLEDGGVRAAAPVVEGPR
jgi:ornithine carbamoyltransferase